MTAKRKPVIMPPRRVAYTPHPYEKKNRGHVWVKDDCDGRVNIFAFTEGHIHNGPQCSKCGYGFCHHCNAGPQQSCAALKAKRKSGK